MEGTVRKNLAWLRMTLCGERGATLVEYGMLVILIAIIALVAVQAFGEGNSTQFTNINTSAG